MPAVYLYRFFIAYLFLKGVLKFLFCGMILKIRHGYVQILPTAPTIPDTCTTLIVFRLDKQSPIRNLISCFSICMLVSDGQYAYYHYIYRNKGLFYAVIVVPGSCTGRKWKFKKIYVMMLGYASENWSKFKYQRPQTK